MPTTRKSVLAALHVRLLPFAALVLRDELLPERILTPGLITRGQACWWRKGG